jgi:Secretion system C-terminal sorting domain
VFSPPNTIFTTHDNWDTIDTTFISENGPLADTSFSPGGLIFGNGDTLAIEGARWDKTDFNHSIAMALSTDLGAHWSELPLPRENGIYYSSFSLTRINWDHIVIAGLDSVGRILQSTDRGASWELDTVKSSDGVPYYNISNTAVTGSGRVIASILPDASNLGSSSLVYLEPAPSSVETWERTVYGTHLYPNPATGILNIQSVEENLPVHIFDILGREVVNAELSPIGTATINVSSLPRGIYVVRLEEFGSMVTVGMLSLVE